MSEHDLSLTKKLEEKEKKEEKEVAQEKEETKEIPDQQVKELLEETKKEIEEESSKATDKILSKIHPELKPSDLMNRHEEMAEDLIKVEEYIPKEMSIDELDVHATRQVQDPEDVQLTESETAYLNHITQRERMCEIDQRIVGSVLDIGAAGQFNPGVFTRHFAKGNPTAACDIKSEGIKRFKEVNPKIPITHCDAKELPFNDESFDTTVLGNLIQYHKDLGKIINEAIRVADNKTVITIPLEKRFPDHLFEFKAKICFRGSIPAFLVLEIIKLKENKNDFDKLE
jgi:hypothetical protein